MYVYMCNIPFGHFNHYQILFSLTKSTGKTSLEQHFHFLFMLVSVIVSLCSPWRDFPNTPLRQEDFPVMSVTTDSKTFFPVRQSFLLALILSFSSL